VAKDGKSKAKNPFKSLAGLEPKPWISMRTGIIIISIASIGMAVLTAIQAIAVKGWVEGILWGIGFGAFIWALFFGMVFINRLLRR
jgi:ABC-type antimicrobial peptide transport system permease subunit